MATKTPARKKPATSRKAAAAKTQRGTSPGSKAAQLKAGRLSGRIAKAFTASERRARKALKDPDEISALGESASVKANENRRDLGAVFEELQTLIRLARAYAKGEYRELPTSHIVAAVAAVIYFVSPIDAIPDVIPGVGLIDDVAVLLFVVKLIADDLSAFRAWEAGQARAASSKASAQRKRTAKTTGSASPKRRTPATKRSPKRAPVASSRTRKSSAVASKPTKSSRKPRARAAVTR